MLQVAAVFQGGRYETWDSGDTFSSALQTYKHKHCGPAANVDMHSLLGCAAHPGMWLHPWLKYTGFYSICHMPYEYKTYKYVTLYSY